MLEMGSITKSAYFFAVLIGRIFLNGFKYQFLVEIQVLLLLEHFKVLKNTFSLSEPGAKHLGVYSGFIF